MPDWPDTYRSDDPRCSDPRFQRRVEAVSHPIPFVSNMLEVSLACGHAPLLFADEEPKVGDQSFCPDCYDDAQKETA